MRQLTFKGFTRSYVSALSDNHSTSIYTLVREAETNFRLVEPLFLYALSHDNIHVLLAASRHSVLYKEYAQLAQAFDYATVLRMFEENACTLPSDYCKVWYSYQSIKKKAERDNRVKSLMRTKILAEQSSHRVTTYRICKDLKLNVANVNAWLKHDAPNKISLDNARLVLNYIETFETRH